MADCLFTHPIQFRHHLLGQPDVLILVPQFHCFVAFTGSGNLLYFRDRDPDMVRGVRDGEFTAQELAALLARDDVLTCPHDTYLFTSAADFMALPVELITPFIERKESGTLLDYTDAELQELLDALVAQIAK